MQRCQQTLTDSARYAAWHSVSTPCHLAELDRDPLQSVPLWPQPPQLVFT